MRTRDKLASELRKVAAQASPANASKYEAFAKRAETGEFDDYADTYVCPITQLYSELTAAGFAKFAARVANGEFNATREESDEWARSPSGQHDEQLEIWAGEFVDHLYAAAADFMPDFESYGSRVQYFAAVKDAIKDLVRKAFEHPELKTAPASPLPEIAGILKLREGLPEGLWTFHHGLRPGSYIEEWWVESATGRLLAAKIDSKSLTYAIVALPSLFAALERLAREVERLRSELEDERQTMSQADAYWNQRVNELERETREECAKVAQKWNLAAAGDIRALNQREEGKQS